MTTGPMSVLFNEALPLSRAVSFQGCDGVSNVFQRFWGCAVPVMPSDSLISPEILNLNLI